MTHYNTALYNFEESLKISPQDSEVVFHLALTHFKLKQIQPALQYFIEYTNINTTNSKGYYWQARLFLELNQ